jgi:hypothetical protein
MRKIEIKIQNVFDWTELNPAVGVLGLDKAVIPFDFEQNQIFKRLTFQGTLTFTDKEDNGINVFSEVSTLNLSAVSERTWVLLRVTLDDVVWYGYFTPRNCKWDYNRKTFSVSPKTDDVYEPFLRDGNQINVATDTRYKVGYNIGGISSVLVTSHGKKLYEAIIRLITFKTWSNSWILDGISSEFLTNDTNPITADTNYWKGMFIAQKTDVLRANEPDIEPATISTLKFEDLFNFLRDYLNVWWDLELTGTNLDGTPIYKFVIEHYDYFDTIGNVIDLTKTTGMVSTDKFYYDEDNIPRSLSMRIDAPKEQVYFVGKPIEYIEGITGDASEKSIQGFVTAVEIKQLSTSNDGFFVICAEESGVDFDYLVYNVASADMPMADDGIPFLIANGHLAISYVMDKFWRLGREYPYATMNDINVVYETVKPSILQDVNIKRCLAFGANDVCETGLFAYLGTYGKIKKAEYRFNGGTALSLAYDKEYDNIILFNSLFSNTQDGIAIKSNVSASVKFYPSADVELRVNILVTFEDTTTDCIEELVNGLTDGGNTVIEENYNKQIASVVYFLELPAGYQIQSNVPLETTEVCT